MEIQTANNQIDFFFGLIKHIDQFDLSPFKCRFSCTTFLKPGINLSFTRMYLGISFRFVLSAFWKTLM